MFGTPDFAFPKLKLAVFVDGCFWHSCPRHANLPVNNRAFWKRKLEANSGRDKLVNRTLRARGWRVLRIWQHELSSGNEKKLIRRIRRAGLCSSRLRATPLGKSREGGAGLLL